MPPSEPPPTDDPVDPWDPRFSDDGVPRGNSASNRRLVRSRGPGGSPEDPRARILRIAVPLLFFAGLFVVAAIFFTGLRPGPQVTVVGREAEIRAAVAERPKRVCFNENNPCAWLTVVEDRLVAFNTNGPLPQEYGTAGIGWCPTSGWFGANSTGSRFDQRGALARGPAPRGLDRFGLRTDAQGRIVINFAELTAGLQEAQVREVQAPDGPHCETIPFDREADLELPGG